MLKNLDTAIGFAVVMLLLSLLITTLVQIAVTLLGLRGLNLLWGVRRLLHQAIPELKDHEKQLTNSVLRHPAVSHLAHVRAIAIRKDEMTKVLQDIADHPENQFDPWYRKILRKVVPASWRDYLRRQDWFRKLVRHPAVLDTAALKTLQGLDKTALAQRVSDWFDSVMDRTSERFKLYTRWITAVLAFAIALLFQIDSWEILQRIADDQKLRAALVELSEPALGEAKKSLT